MFNVKEIKTNGTIQDYEIAQHQPSDQFYHDPTPFEEEAKDNMRWDINRWRKCGGDVETNDDFTMAYMMESDGRLSHILEIVEV